MISSRLKKLMLFRLLFATLLLFCPKISEVGAGVPFYTSTVLACVLTTFYVIWFVTRRRLRWLALVQVLGDLSLVSYLVLFTGGAESLFVVLYPITILSSALVLGEKNAVVATTVLGSLGYLTSSVLASQFDLTSVLPQSDLYLFYGMGMRIAIFVGVGYLSRFLSGAVLELQSRVQLSERLSALGEVVSKIAHEVRNPLSAIRTAAEVLKDSLAGKVGAQEERMIEIVDSESDRLTKTLQRILSYARQAQPDPKILLLDPLIDRALTLVQLNSRVHSNGVAVEKKYDKSGTRIYADEEQVVGAFLNLILNAYQAMPTGGILKIAAEEVARGTTISIEDSGGGIPHDKLKDLFSPFKSTKKGGTGLGLAEVQKIVTLHEGKVEVDSCPGKGTTFRLFFPKP